MGQRNQKKSWIDSADNLRFSDIAVYVGFNITVIFYMITVWEKDVMENYWYFPVFILIAFILTSLFFVCVESHTARDYNENEQIDKESLFMKGKNNVKFK